MAALPPGVAARLQAGARALRDGDPATALRCMRDGVAAAPGQPEPLRYLALAQLHARQPADALATLQRALAIAPRDAQLLCDLGSARAATGAIDAACSAWRDATESDPSLATAWFNLGRNRQLQGQTDDAIAALRGALAASPQLLPAHVLLGDALAHAGDFDAASRSYRAALELHPTCGDAWRGLSNIKTRTLSDADGAAMQALLARHDLPPTDRVAIGHAFGKFCEDRGRHEEAFATFSQANALQQRLTPWRLDALQRYVAAALAATATLPHARDPELGREAIFVVGLPRSGSSLVEHILAAHPDVEGAGELPDLGIVIQQESARRGRQYPDWVPEATAEDWGRLGRAYLARTARWRTHAARAVDKQPDNWKHAGVLRAMLPGATVIETRRDPLETGWSCFKQQFYAQPHFANDLGHIGSYLRISEATMDAWRLRAPDRLVLHRHEALLAEPEAAIRRLLAACGLPFDAACLDFRGSQRAVRSASTAQVREPLTPPAPRAAAQGARLDPLRRALGLATG